MPGHYSMIKVGTKVKKAAVKAGTKAKKAVKTTVKAAKKHRGKLTAGAIIAGSMLAPKVSEKMSEIVASHMEPKIDKAVEKKVAQIKKKVSRK